MNSSVERREILFSGMVQGVGFRYTTRRIAQPFAVTGFVQNLADGRVQVVAEGLAEEIDRFLAAIDSELGHYVTHVDRRSLPPSGQSDRFEIRV